jgi:hypothetical protein
LRIRDTLHCKVAGGPPPWGAGNYARASWGLRAASAQLSTANTNQTPFIGFRLDLLALSNVSDPTWKTEYVNWDSSTRRSIDTGLVSGTIRDLLIELSGVDQTVRWYVDGNLVDSYKPTANDVGGQNLNAAEWAVCCEVAASASSPPTPTLTLSFHLAVGPLTTCLYHDA